MLEEILFKSRAFMKIENISSNNKIIAFAHDMCVYAEISTNISTNMNNTVFTYNLLPQ